MKESLNAAAEDAGLSGVVQLPGHGQDLPGPSADQQLGQPAAQPLGAVLVRAPDLGRRDPHALHLLVHPLLHPLRTLGGREVIGLQDNVSPDPALRGQHLTC